MRYSKAVILEDADTSDKVDLFSELRGVVVPASMSGTTLKFQVKNLETGDWYDIKNLSAATDYTIAKTAGGFVPVDSRLFVGLETIRIVTSATQGADRELLLVHQ